jgi:putative restriction endonuclease
VRYWWVNQNQTFRQEIGGGFLWSPKRKSDNTRNPYYEFMREVVPGDVVFSFVDTRIHALGIVQSYCYESPKPMEFGTAGHYWNNVGWKVDVQFRVLANRVRPKDHMERIGPALPKIYSPLQATGDGIQSVYLTKVEPILAAMLFALIGTEANRVEDSAGAVAASARGMTESAPTVDKWEEHIEAEVMNARDIAETERAAIVQARRGQGKFRERVQSVERACRITRVDRPEHLIASHIKPWRDANNDDRLNGENGLMLTPTIDHLFDRGFISFEDKGRVIVSPVADTVSLNRMGIQTAEPMNVGAFTEGQRQYLDYHRENVLLLARVRSMP